MQRLDQDKLNDAALTAAKAGKSNDVNELIARGASVNFAIAGYAEAGHADKVEALIQQVVQGFHDTAQKGYHESKLLLDIHQRMRILAATNNVPLRRTMANTEMGMDAKRDREEIDGMLETAAVINKYINLYQFTFEQAEELHHEILRIRQQYEPGIIASFFGETTGKEVFGEILNAITRIRSQGVTKSIVSIPMQEFGM